MSRHLLLGLHCRLSRWFIATLLLLLQGGTLGSIYAQQTLTSAALSGTVEDESGARVPKASISAKNLDRNQSWTTESDAAGRFQFLLLPVGPYELKIAAPGFAPYTNQLTLTLGQAISVPARLRLEGTSETVLVTSSAPVIETVRTQLSETVASREIGNLPLNGRQFLDLALLSPAVSRTNKIGRAHV